MIIFITIKQHGWSVELDSRPLVGLLNSSNARSRANLCGFLSANKAIQISVLDS